MPEPKCDYWLITLNEQTFGIETNILLITVENYKSASEQLQNSGQWQLQSIVWLWMTVITVILIIKIMIMKNK